MHVSLALQSPLLQSWSPPQVGAHVVFAAAPAPERQQISPPVQLAVPRQSIFVPVQLAGAVHEGVAVAP